MSPGKIIIESNIAQKLSAFTRYNKLFNRQVMAPAFHLILNQVGFESAANFWITSSGVGAVGLPVDPTRPTMRTGRLLGSIVNAPRFSAGRLPGTVARFKDQAFATNTSGFSGGRSEGIRRVRVSKNLITAVIGSDVPYARRVEDDRPYLHPAAEKVAGAKITNDILQSAVEESFRGANI